MTDAEIEGMVTKLVHIWLTVPRRLGMPRPSVEAVIENIAKMLEQAEPIESLHVLQQQESTS